MDVLTIVGFSISFAILVQLFAGFIQSETEAIVL